VALLQVNTAAWAANSNRTVFYYSSGYTPWLTGFTMAASGGSLLKFTGTQVGWFGKLVPILWHCGCLVAFRCDICNFVSCIYGMNLSKFDSDPVNVVSCRVSACV
jgi:hypothetical protein